MLERQALVDEQAQLAAQYRQLRELHGDLQTQLTETERQMRQIEGALGLLQRWLRAENGTGANGDGQ